MGNIFRCIRQHQIHMARSRCETCHSKPPTGGILAFGDATGDNLEIRTMLECCALSEDLANSALPFTPWLEFVERSARMKIDIREALRNFQAVDDGNKQEMLPHITAVPCLAGVVILHPFRHRTTCIHQPNES